MKPIAVTLDNTKMGCRLGNAFQEIISILYEHITTFTSLKEECQHFPFTINTLLRVYIHRY